MAPRRHHHGHGHVEVQGLLGIDSDMDAGVSDPNVTRCCVPTGECLRANSLGGSPNNNDYALISLDDLRDTVRVTCNNEHCTAGRYMHRECFEAWEQSVLTYLKTCGRARSWSERQRHQNLWTKKGYDLAFKACGCKCGRGHLKKDLDWMPPPPTSSIIGRVEEIDVGKKKKRRNRNSRPTLAISAHPVPTYHNPTGQMPELRGRAGSLSSSTGSSSPPVSASSISPVHSGTKKKSKFEFSDRIRAGAGANGIFNRRLDFSSFNFLPRNKLNSYHIKVLATLNFAATGSFQNPVGCNCWVSLSQPSVSRIINEICSVVTEHLFPRHIKFPTERNDKNSVKQGFYEKWAARGVLGVIDGTHVEILAPPVTDLEHPPFVYINRKGKHSINVMLMEDEGNHGNDDTRCFILSTLASQGRSRVQCILCEEQMLVFDRYPLVDGTFFLSPRQHAKNCIEVKVEGRTQFLTSVCMACLEGGGGRAIRCRFCTQQWDGSSLVLGTMYSYDIFAAMPCCTERIKCNSCFKPVLHPQQRLNFFSDYSHMVPCPHCRTLDTHFVKPLAYCYTKQAFQLYQQWP